MIVTKYIDESSLINLTMKQMSIFKCAPVKLTDLVSQKDLDLIHFSVLNRSESRVFKLRSFLFLIAVLIEIFQFLQALKVMSGPVHRNQDIILGLQVLIQLLMVTTYTQSCKNKGYTFAIYLNSLFKFKKTYSKVFADQTWRHLSTIEYLNLLFIRSILFCSVIFSPCLVLGFHWDNPCKPTLIGAFLLEECYDTLGHQIGIILFVRKAIVKLGVFSLNIWVWWFSVNGTAFILITVNIIATVMTHDCIRLFWEKLKTSESIYEDALLYRQIQIFNVLNNFVQQGCLGVFIICTTLMISNCFSLLISTLNEINIFMTVTFLLVAVNSTIAILLFLGGMVSVHLESKKKLLNIRRLELTYYSRAVRRWARRFWRSCEIIKFKFGSNNFIEKQTPLKCLDFAINLTVQFLLLSRNK